MLQALWKASLVTLSMSRRTFYDTGSQASLRRASMAYHGIASVASGSLAGIAKYLKFPKRAAIYNEHPTATTPGELWHAGCSEML